MSEGVADGGHEAREVEARRSAIGHVDVAHHHEGAASVFGELEPGEFLGAALRGDGDFHGEGVAIEHLNAVHIEHLVADGETIAVWTDGDHTQFFGRKVVDHDGGGVFAQSDGALEGLFLLGFLAGSGAGGEFAVDAFEERHFVVECFETETRIEGDVSAIANDVAERRAVGGFHSACPVIGGVVFEIGRNPVERGEFVEGHIPREVGGLAIVERPAEVAEGVHDGVFPSSVFGGVEFLVHHHIGLLDFGIGAGHEAEVDILRGIPTELQGTIPEEVAGEAERERTVVELFDVALLQFVVVARKIGHQRDVLRQRVDAEITQYA